MDTPHLSHAGMLPFQRTSLYSPVILAVLFAPVLVVIIFSSKKKFELDDIGQRELGGNTIQAVSWSSNMPLMQLRLK